MTTSTFARVTITTGQRFGSFANGSKGTVAELRDAAERAGLVCGEPWDCGSVPCYGDVDERDDDADDGSACDILICVNPND